MEALQFHLEQDKDLSSSFERLLLPHLPLQFDVLSSPNRHEVENYIADQFYRSYQAKIKTFLPYLLSTATDGRLLAVMGFQPAGEVKSY